MEKSLYRYCQKMHHTNSEEVIKYILKQILEGLNFLHSNHIIHRDIKSDNILYNTSGDIKLADFGYAAQLTKQEDLRKTRCGTVCWMAPELIDKQPYNVKIDIWSLGIVALELAEGASPYVSN